jgi:lactoylglutathione lyase
MSEAAADTIRFRMRHTMLPVADIERSVDFYTRLLGMKVLRRRVDPAAGRAIAYVGYGEEASSTVLELIAAKGQPAEPWAGHIAVAVSDLRALCARLEADRVAFAMPLKEVNNS